MLRRKCGVSRKTAMGQSRRFDPPATASGLPPTSDIITLAELVRFVP
jgi:hypothetical protein